MSYVPLSVKLEEIAGIEPSLKAMKLPKGKESDSYIDFSSSEKGFFMIGPSDADLAKRLVRAGPDHGKFSRGIVAWLRVDMQTGFMIEFETYRAGVECLSTSSAMHGELKTLIGSALARQKQEDLSDKVYTRILTVSYQALRSMYRARKNHRHPDWRIFCRFIERMPWFDTLIYPEFKSEKKVKLLK